MWSPDGKTVYFMSDRGGAQNLWVQAGDRRLPGAHAFHERPRPLADAFFRRKDDRLRAELRPLEVRHGDGRGGRDSDRPRGDSGRAGRRAPFARAPDRRARGLARRKEARLRDSRRDLRRVRQGRRRRDARDAHERPGVADRLGARQPADRVCLRPGRRPARVSLRLQDRRRDPTHERARRTTPAPASRPTASSSRSCAAPKSCGSSTSPRGRSACSRAGFSTTLSTRTARSPGRPTASGSRSSRRARNSSRTSRSFRRPEAPAIPSASSPTSSAAR